MKISETNGYYVVSFFPDAEEVEIDDKTEEKGYKAILGIQGGQHVVMKVMYDKNIYPYDEDDRKNRFPAGYDKQTVKQLASNIGECDICKRLDADVAKITEIRLLDQTPTRSIPVAQAPQIAQTVSSKSELFNTGNPLQDLMARMMFDTKLNQTGQVATALALEDSDLLERVMPKSIDGVVNLMANLTELSQGKGDIYRSPEEVTAYVKALREGAKPTNAEKDKKTSIPIFKRAATVIVS